MLETVKWSVVSETMALLPALNERAAPAPSVVPAAPAIAACSVAIVFGLGGEMNTPPVWASVMVVTEPAVRAVVVARLACVEVNELVALPLKTDVPLKFVVEPIWLISLRIEANSVCRAVDSLEVRPPLAASVAIVTARLSWVVPANSAIGGLRRPTPLEAFWLDWFRAAMLAPRPSAIERPAASSDPELILSPVDNC